MKIITYNINGIRSSLNKGLEKFIESTGADIWCFQEVRAKVEITEKLLYPNQLTFFDGESNKNIFSSFYAYFNCAEKAGYAGTMILTRHKPDRVIYGFDDGEKDSEGRTLTLFFEKSKFALVNAYIPNGNSRLDFKMEYISKLYKYLSRLVNDYYSVAVCGDFNIAHNEIDLTNPRECRNKSVFLPIERKAFDDLLKIDFIDCFRHLYPEKVEYSWRSYRAITHESQTEWTGRSFWKYRIDYFLLHNKGNVNLIDCQILQTPISDHLPVLLTIEIKN